MASFLDLCKDLARETGTLSGGAAAIVSVTGATGRIEKMVNWVRKAWVNIQNERDDWSWMEEEFTSPIMAGQARYGAAALSLPRLATFKRDTTQERMLSLYDPAIGFGDEGALRERDWQWWRVRYARASTDPNRPTDWAISPQGELCLGATPDKNYVIRGVYRKTPQILTENTDIPEMPVRFHDLITWEAIRLLSNSDEAPQHATTSTIDYITLRSHLERDQLPEIRIGGGPLA